MNQFENTLAFAQSLDAADPLAKFREEFHIPEMTDAEGNTKPEIYLCGNSLGLQPKLTRDYLNDELDKWQAFGVKGHFSSSHPWMPYHEFLTQKSAKLVGALESEVVCMNSLTVNLHLMMVSFYRPTKERYKILIEDHAFPSDTYAVQSQAEFHGFDADDAIIKIAPRAGEDWIREQDLIDLIEREGDSIALVMLPGVQYYTGQVFPMQSITKAAHAKGCLVGFDLAHAAGNIPMQMHDWDVDFACWCSYKYLNSGPGSVAGCFVHERHHKTLDLPRFCGWWGHDKATRFKMGPNFVPIESAEAWQLSNPPILSLAAIRASLDIVEQAGGIEVLREKSLKLTDYLVYLLEQELADEMHILTPLDHEQRGCQLSLTVKIANQSARELFDAIEAAGVTGDWREPNVIRVAPVPLYNSYQDVYQFVQILKDALHV
jgi:kynureninase